MILSAAIAMTMAKAPAQEPNLCELVVMLDISGSTEMTQKALRGYAIQRAQNVLDEYGDGNVRVAFAMHPVPHALAVVKGFTTDTSQMAKYLAGDIQVGMPTESATDVALNLIDQLKWSRETNVRRMLLILGNEPPDQGPTTIDKSVEKAAKAEVSIHTYFTPYHPLAGSPDPWRDWATKGGGDFRLMTESDAMAYTDLYDQTRRSLILAAEGKRVLDQLGRKRRGG